MTYIFKEPVRMLVIHPAYGKLEVKAYCPLDARIQAANIWDVPLEDLQRAQIGIEKCALACAGETEEACATAK